MTTLAALLALTAQTGQEPIVVDGFKVDPRHLMVKVEGLNVLDRIEASGVQVVKFLPQISWAVVEAPVGRLQATRKLLSGLKGVTDCEFDGVGEMCYTPNDPYWSYQWDMRFMKADLAWDTSIGTAGPVVAVIDTGVNITHPDLAQNIWTNPGEIPGNGIDDEGNGYVDDVHGYDFYDEDADVSEYDHQIGHGTGMASLVAGRGNNGIGMTGVAPRARVMPLKIVGSNATPPVSLLADAYIYAADMGARVFSLSFGRPAMPSQAERDALFYAYQKGAVIVAAAGNSYDVTPYYPAAYDFVIGVGACGETGNKREYSNFGRYVDVVAPSDGTLITCRNDGQYWAYSGGTSVATAHVAGLVALMKGAKPNASRNRLFTLLLDSSRVVNDSVMGEYSTYGAVDAKAAMDHLVANTTPTPHTSKVNFVSPFVFGNNGKATVSGRMLEGAVVKIGGNACTMLSTSRDQAVFKLKPYTGPMTIEDSLGNVLATYASPLPSTRVWPLTEAYGLAGNTTSGGFAEALNLDGNFLNTVWTNDGKYLKLYGVFHAMPTSGPVTLVMKRSYLKAKYGTETIRIMNPGSKTSGTVLSTTAVPVGDGILRYDIADIAPFVDSNGSVTVSVELKDSPKTAVLQVDMAYFKK